MKESLNRRLTVYFLIMMALTAFVSVAWNYHSTQQSIMEMERSQAEGCTKAIGSLLEHYGDALEEDPSSKEYIFLQNAVHNFCRGFGQEGIYLYTVDSQTGTHRMLMTVDGGEETAIPIDEQLHGYPFPELELDGPEAALTSGSSKLQRVVWKSDYNTTILWLSLCSPSNATSPIFLGMEYNVELENSQILRDFLADILLPVFALGVAFLVLDLMIRKRVVTPIRRISDHMKRFAHNTSELPEPLDIHFDDEIGEIASSFEAMTEEITTYVGNIERLTQERVQNDVQMDIARRIQYGMVPEKTTLTERDFCICAMTRPAKGVGGDFYDCFKKDDGTICIVMGDVSGKGISGAIFMAMIKTIIREKLMLGLTPAQALNQANEQLMAQNPEGLFATVFVGILDPRTGELRYANAGHTYPILLGSEVSFLKPDPGIALGLFDDADIIDETMQLSSGQGIMLYTDGLTDALNADRVPFGMDRLLGTLAGTTPCSDPAEDTLLEVSKAVGAYCEGVEPFDDMAVLVLFRTDAPSEDDMHPIPVAASSFARIREDVFAQAGDTPATRQALLACDEVLANIVQYSRATQLAFWCERQEHTLCVVFEDNGIAFDPTTYSPDEKAFEQLDGGGMGLILIHQTASSVRYERRNETNVLTLDFALS